MRAVAFLGKRQQGLVTHPLCYERVNASTQASSTAMTPRCQTLPAPAGSAACCARAGRRASGTAWSAPRSGCAGQPASGSSWRRADVHLGG